jgi:hypothetical protein
VRSLDRRWRKEATEDFREIHNEELHNLYSSLNIIIMIKYRMIKWVGHVVRMIEKCVESFCGKERLLGRPRRRWKQIKVDLKETASYSVDWTHLALDKGQRRALVNTVMNLRLPKKILGISLVDQQLLASLEGLSSMQLVKLSTVQ